MGEMRKLERYLCATCKYRFKFGNYGHNGKNACNYLDIEGKSRIFEDGKKVVPDGYCDKYEKGAQALLISDRWVHTPFYKRQWDKDKGKGVQECTDITKEK